MNAKSLRGGSSGTVGIIAPKTVETNIFLNALLQKITYHEKNSFLDYIVSRPGKGNMSNIRRLIRAGKVDGFIFVHPKIDQADYEFLQEQKIPFVLLHFKPRNFPHENLNYYLTDHEYGGYIATKHLLELGRTKIVSLTEDTEDLQFIERSAGFRRALEEYDIPFSPDMLIKGKSSDYELGERFVYQQKDRLHRIDAIFAQADILALGIIRGLSRLGINVPEDISVMGYDDIQIGQYSTPRLSTVRQPTDDMDYQACLRIQELIQKKNLSSQIQKVFKPKLVLRDSCSVHPTVTAGSFSGTKTKRLQPLEI